jgi:hypothetical protein
MLHLSTYLHNTEIGASLICLLPAPEEAPARVPHAGAKSRGFRLIPYSLLFLYSAPMDEDLYAIASLHLIPPPLSKALLPSPLPLQYFFRPLTASDR